uniref:hypothetical protein n=1 Tax=Thaumasiovibrio occultus TaxID=1891184 RepID=UPI001863FB6F|nr:hypothetical protein [Thaumasiovibrio occultus]
MKRMIFIAAMLTSLPLMAVENIVYRCESGGALRVIEVQYPSGNAVPCNVTYTKGGDVQTLWRAANSAGYCEKQAAEFAAKQQSWGWQCQKVEASGATTPVAPARPAAPVSAPAQQPAAPAQPVAPVEAPAAPAPVAPKAAVEPAVAIEVPAAKPATTEIPAIDVPSDVPAPLVVEVNLPAVDIPVGVPSTASIPAVNVPDEVPDAPKQEEYNVQSVSVPGF